MDSYLFSDLHTSDPTDRATEESLARLKARQKQEIRVECNMEEFPYFRLSKKDSKTFNKIHFAREVRNTDGGSVKQRWVVVADSELGLPGPFDQDVYVAMEAIIDEIGIHPDGYVPFTCYRVAQLLGRDHGGSTYRQIRQALTRMVSTRITSEKAFYLRDEKVYISETFHLYDSVRFEERVNPKRSSAAFEYNLLFPCRWYVFSRRQNYTKPLDLNLYKQLSSPTAKKLFRYLDKRRHAHPNQVTLDLFHLSDVLPLTPGFPSKLKQVLAEPHQQLQEVGFIKNVAFSPVSGTKNWQIVYTFPQDIPEIAGAHPGEPLAQMLVNRGLSANVAGFLAQQYPERVQPQVEAFDWLLATNGAQVKHNPPGYLRKAIEDNYAPPPGLLSDEEREEVIQKGIEENQERRKQDEEETRRAQELKGQIEQVKAHLPPDELAKLRKEAEENLNGFLRDRLLRDRRSEGSASYSSLSALEYEIDRTIESRYLNLPGPSQ